MIVGKGNRSGKEYTAKQKYDSFKEMITAIVKEKKRVDEITDDSKALIKETIEYWIDEYRDLDEDKSSYTKENKKLIDIRIAEAYKQDETIRNALEYEAMMIQEAEEDEGPF